MAPRCRIRRLAIAVHPHDRLGWVIEFEHAASEGLVFEITRHEPSEAIAVAIDLLAGIDELRITGVAPTLEHPDVVSGIRGLTRGFDWSRAEVRAVA